ncbi:MAG: orotidine-5'-phosphate decarboxylase [Deltaproteobacteria bacterium]|nr:orotidine-5'-phosphate decarboxylase [Deltaproteobacteria bacterium]
MQAAVLARARARLAFALDYPSLELARRGAEQVHEHVGVAKVGLELFVREGPAAVAAMHELGLAVFLDLKLHDIPATVARAVGSAAAHGARYLTVHAAGGRAMLEQAARQAEQASGALTLLGVTVLTSLDGADLAAQGLHASPAEHAERLGRLAWEAGIRGFICSAGEAPRLRQTLGPQALLVTPGIRPLGGQAEDQKRVATPGAAIRAGADLLVVGRPIRDAPDPVAAARSIVRQIAAALPETGS